MAIDVKKPLVHDGHSRLTPRRLVRDLIVITEVVVVLKSALSWKDRRRE